MQLFYLRVILYFKTFVLVLIDMWVGGLFIRDASERNHVYTTNTTWSNAFLTTLQCGF